MFTKKTPKSQKENTGEFVTYNPHSIELSKRVWPDVVKVISIDPGIRNLALRVESRGIRNGNHPIKTIVFEKLRIADAERKVEGRVDQLFTLVTQFLEKYREIFKESHMVIIERQLPINYKAVRIEQHIVTYFMILFKDRMPTLPLIYEIDSKLKGRELGASKHLNERGIKQWSVEYAMEELRKREDDVGLAILAKNKKKLDDLCDTQNQIDAFFSFNGWPMEFSSPRSSLSPLSLNNIPKTILKMPKLLINTEAITLPNTLRTPLKAPIKTQNSSIKSLPSIQKLPALKLKPLSNNTIEQKGEQKGEQKENTKTDEIDKRTEDTIEQPIQKLKLKIVSN